MLRKHMRGQEAAGYPRGAERRQELDHLIECLEGTVVNVGWLAPEHAYPRGDVTPMFRSALFRLCKRATLYNLGFHVCELEPCAYPWTSTDVGPPPDYAMLYETCDGETASLGAGVIIVRGAECNYAAPNLIYHYVTTHGYRPPDAFIEAVLRA
jgi:hypothetical protein